MTLSPYNQTLRPRRIAGFTLVEVLIASTISAIILTGVLATFLMLTRSGIRTSNYSLMEAETRIAFEQLGIDTRMANDIQSRISGGVITSITLTIPNKDMTATAKVTYGYDQSDPSDKKLFYVPGDDPTVTIGRKVLISKVSDLTFLRYDTSSLLIPTSTDDSTVKHIQVSVNVRRSTTGVAVATQIIRSSAFTIRNKVL